MNEPASLALIDLLFKASRNIRYVALYQTSTLVSRQREDLLAPSETGSDRYEELLVNPALLTLARQRGEIDCGGLRFLIVAYGNFYQFVRPFELGHISVCIELNANPIDEARIIEATLSTWSQPMV